LNAMIEKNIDSYPIYVTSEILLKEANVGKRFYKAPEGFAIRLSKDSNYIKTNFDKIYINTLLESVYGKSGHLYEGLMTTTLQNLQNLYNYSKFNNDIESMNNTVISITNVNNILIDMQTKK